MQRLLYFVLPSPCLTCSQPVWEPRGSLGLCPLCRHRLVRWPDRGCTICGRPIAGAVPAHARCGECRRHPPPYARLISAWSYQPPVDAALMALKFRRLEYLGGHFGRRLAGLLGERLDGCEVVVPVPLHWARFLARGYNQAAAIAGPLARELGLPVVRALRRRRPTPAQSRLDRDARRKNLRRGFAARRESKIRGRHVLLVDDVVTTGATVEAAARRLRRAGAAAVTVVTAARTPTREEALLLPGGAGRPARNPSPRPSPATGEGAASRPAEADRQSSGTPHSPG